MRYFIERASERWDNQCTDAPCEGAIAGSWTIELEGGITEKLKWVIDIDTLEELMEFIKREGEIVISPAQPKRGAIYPHIVIYDGYL